MCVRHHMETSGHFKIFTLHQSELESHSVTRARNLTQTCLKREFIGLHNWVRKNNCPNLQISMFTTISDFFFSPSSHIKSLREVTNLSSLGHVASKPIPEQRQIKYCDWPAWIPCLSPIEYRVGRGAPENP